MGRATLGKGQMGLALSAALENIWRGLAKDAAEMTGGEATRASIIEGKGEWSDVGKLEL